MTSLYKISEQAQKSISELLDMDLPEDAVKDTIEAIQGELEEKIISVAAYIKNQQAEISNMKQYESDMKARREKLEKNVK